MLGYIGYSLIFLLTPTVLLANATPLKDPLGIAKFIEGRIKEPTISKSKKEQEEVNAYVDFQEMSKEVLGKYRSSLSQEDLLWFQENFKNLLTRTVYEKAPGFLKSVKTTYKDLKETPQDTCDVISIVQKRAEKNEVIYKMRKQGKNAHWKVVDMIIDEDSWIENTRLEIEDVWKKEKWPGVKQRLEKRLHSPIATQMH